MWYVQSPETAFLSTKELPHVEGKSCLSQSLVPCYNSTHFVNTNRQTQINKVTSKNCPNNEDGLKTSWQLRVAVPQVSGMLKRRPLSFELRRKSRMQIWAQSYVSWPSCQSEVERQDGSMTCVNLAN